MGLMAKRTAECVLGPAFVCVLQMVETVSGTRAPSSEGPTVAPQFPASRCEPDRRGRREYPHRELVSGGDVFR